MTDDAVQPCAHDWRRDPHAPLRASNPLQFRLECAECGTVRWKLAGAPSNDPRDWPKA